MTPDGAAWHWRCAPGAPRSRTATWSAFTPVPSSGARGSQRTLRAVPRPLLRRREPGPLLEEVRLETRARQVPSPDGGRRIRRSRGHDGWRQRYGGDGGDDVDEDDDGGWFGCGTTEGSGPGRLAPADHPAPLAGAGGPWAAGSELIPPRWARTAASAEQTGRGSSGLSGTTRGRGTQCSAREAGGPRAAGEEPRSRKRGQVRLARATGRLRRGDRQDRRSLRCPLPGRRSKRIPSGPSGVLMALAAAPRVPADCAHRARSRRAWEAPVRARAPLLTPHASGSCFSPVLQHLERAPAWARRPTTWKRVSAARTRSSARGAVRMGSARRSLRLMARAPDRGAPALHGSCSAAGGAPARALTPRR